MESLKELKEQKKIILDNLNDEDMSDFHSGFQEKLDLVEQKIQALENRTPSKPSAKTPKPKTEKVAKPKVVKEKEEKVAKPKVVKEKEEKPPKPVKAKKPVKSEAEKEAERQAKKEANKQKAIDEKAVKSAILKLKKKMLGLKESTHIRNFMKVWLAEKADYQTITKLLSALQNDIVKKIIRKTSPYADQINIIQDVYLEAVRNIDGKNNPIEEISLTESQAKKFEDFLIGDEWTSSKLMIAYLKLVRLQNAIGDEIVNEAEATKLKDKIERAFRTKQIHSEDPYANELKKALNELKSWTSNTLKSRLRVDLKGLGNLPTLVFRKR